MRVRDVMRKDPITVDPEVSIYDAQEIMRKKNIRRLPVVEKGKLVGMVTQRLLLGLSFSGNVIKHMGTQLSPGENEGEGHYGKTPRCPLPGHTL